MAEHSPIRHDTEENWEKAKNFVPPAGVMIIYDGVLENGVYKKLPKIKLGDGVTLVNALPFFELKPLQPKITTEESVLIIN